MKLTLDLILAEMKNGFSPAMISKKYKVNKSTLQYYLRKLKKKDLIEKVGYGTWIIKKELKKEVSKSTKYGSVKKIDSIRGHAYIWNARLDKTPKNWNKRLKILKKRKINFKLVGAKGTTPRIKVLGRKVWLCNHHLRIFDKKEESYYADNAPKSRLLAFKQIKLILTALNHKLGTNLKPSAIRFQREHYALIKNALAIEENRKGNIWRVKDQNGEWLIIDDSLGRGGELETVGKKALANNVPLQKWWNDHKKNNFEVDSSFILKAFGMVHQNMHGMMLNQQMNDKNIVKHQKVLDKMIIALDKISLTMDKIEEDIKHAYR